MLLLAPRLQKMWETNFENYIEKKQTVPLSILDILQPMIIMIVNEVEISTTSNDKRRNNGGRKGSWLHWEVVAGS